MLAARILGREATPPPVPPGVCEACCQQGRPDGPRLNSVVAALVYREASVLSQTLPAADAVQASLTAAREFAVAWLPGERHPRPSESLPATFHIAKSIAPDEGGGGDASAIRIGLAGPAEGFGLAQVNYDIATHLKADRWLVRGRGDRSRPAPCRVECAARELTSRELATWLTGLDAVVFVERPPFALLPEVAAAMGIRVVCVPDWEWLRPAAAWLPYVDLMLCPTRHTFEFVCSWAHRFGFAWRVAFVAWPIDVDRFAFRLRRRCERFVFVNGSGGWPATAEDRPGETIRRKALAAVLEAARLAPEIPMIVYADAAAVADPPVNVICRRPPADNRQLYAEGDVCLQPSHWEGIGLPLLECQAAGMPLITVDAPPMNEHHPMATVPARLTAVRLVPDCQIPAAVFSPVELANLLRRVHRCRLANASRAARRFVVGSRNWKTAAPRLRREIELEVRRGGVACR